MPSKNSSDPVKTNKGPGKGLGKGLEALFGSDNYQYEELNKSAVLQISLDKITANPYQPRKEFDEKAINELAQSIKEHGVIQPVIVRKSIRGYILIAGERRYRASQVAGLSTIPAIEKDFTDDQMREVALIENLQREDLNAIEIALAYDKLTKEIGYTQEQLAKRVGKSRSEIANHLRLLQLPQSIRDNVSRGTISYGHARAMLGLQNVEKQETLAEKIIKHAISVRETEEIVKALLESVSRETTKDKKLKKVVAPTSADVRIWQKQLERQLGTAVKIVEGKKKGRIEIDYFSKKDLERILQIMADGWQE